MTALIVARELPTKLSSQEKRKRRTAST